MKQEAKKIILVDDDQELCNLLSEYLEREGFDVSSIHDGQSAIDTIQDETQYDAIVLDIMMPKLSGIEVLQSLRSRINTPILMLTGRGDDIDRILGLEMGADDYLGKPCNPRELSARLKAILRRTTQSEKVNQRTLSAQGIQIDLGKREAKLHQCTLNLTSAEFDTLVLLVRSAGKTLSKEFLTEQVLQRKLSPYDRSIDVHVSRIRQKLASQPEGKDIIKTVRGLGYQLIVDAE